MCSQLNSSSADTAPTRETEREEDAGRREGGRCSRCELVKVTEQPSWARRSWQVVDRQPTRIDRPDGPSEGEGGDGGEGDELSAGPIREEDRRHEREEGIHLER